MMSRQSENAPISSSDRSRFFFTKSEPERLYHGSDVMTASRQSSERACELRASFHCEVRASRVKTVASNYLLARPRPVIRIVGGPFLFGINWAITRRDAASCVDQQAIFSG